MSDEVSAEELYELSAEAFSLAREAAAAARDDTIRRERALALLRRAPDFAALVRDSRDRGLASALSEARVDLNYVTTGGTAPMSLRLAQVLRDEEALRKPR